MAVLNLVFSSSKGVLLGELVDYDFCENEIVVEIGFEVAKLWLNALPFVANQIL
jgi:hypothetical protein